MISAKRTRRTASTGLGQVPIRDRDIALIRPSPENDQLYRPVDPADRENQALVASIREHGVIEPLVITEDGYILSGHRRFAAAKLLGLIRVPCRVVPIRRLDDVDAFVRLLREHNRQRDKTRDEKLREEIVSANPEAAHVELCSERIKRSRVATRPIELVGRKRRARISPAKHRLLRAILRIIQDRSRYWPLSDRQIHYALLNDPPLRHASKPDSIYDNTPQSYKSLVELLTRARIAGLIPFEAIADETRPVSKWNAHRDPRSYIARKMDGFLRDYWRDLVQSQPNQIEIVGEKNTVASILKPVASDYCIPLTVGRGYCSLPPRYEMVKRFRTSGKQKLILLILSDFDPDGEEIAHSFARSMRDDFSIDSVHPVKVALTAEQVKKYKLPPVMTAKPSSVHHGKFVERHGEHVFELETLPPERLQAILREAINSVIDVDAFNAEVEFEKRDAAFLEGVRRTVHSAIRSMNLDDAEESP